jgi:hypothetical protein
MSVLTSVQVLFLYQEAELHTFWCDLHLRSLTYLRTIQCPIQFLGFYMSPDLVLPGLLCFL